MHHAVLPGMVARGYGRVVTVASDAARVGSTGEAVYAACKAGMMGLSKTLALCPGFAALGWAMAAGQWQFQG